jgi:ABC-type transporter Mla MlaB component
MEKRITSKKWKGYLEKRSKKELKKKQKRNKERKQNQTSNSKFLTPRNPKNYQYISAPEIFSFIDNPESLLLYFKTARIEISNRNQVYLELSKIKRLSSDAIALLIATIEDPRFHRHLPLSGNAPEDLKLQTLFIQSGFFKYVQSNAPRVKTENLLLHTLTKNKVEPLIAKQASLLGIEHTFKNNDIFEPLYEMLIECMSNTNFHAGLEKQGKYEWWLYVYKNPENNVTSYSFLDLGVGIFKSIPVKTFVKITNFIGFSSNVDLVSPLIQGKIKSRTKEEIRGKGLPQIYSLSKHANIKKFTIISNDVFADFDNENYYRLKTSFEGTFLYWELHPNA